MIQVSKLNPTELHPSTTQTTASSQSSSPVKLEDFGSILTEKEALSAEFNAPKQKTDFVRQISNKRQIAKNPIDKSKVDPEILKAAQGMESVFVSTMLETMRKTVPENEMSMNNHATEIYRSMLDGEIAQKIAKNNSVGLSDLIIDYLESHRYNSK